MLSQLWNILVRAVFIVLMIGIGSWVIVTVPWFVWVGSLGVLGVLVGITMVIQSDWFRRWW